MTDKRRLSAPDADYAVGNCRPPQHTRFQPGRSGNPKGRPKGSKNFSTFLAEELAQPVTLTENGRRKRMQKRQALAKQLVNKALSNDPRATGHVLDQIARMEGSSEAPAAYQFDRREDALVMDSVVRRIRMAKEPLADVDGRRDDSENKP